MDERKIELSVDEYKSLLVSDHMLYHIIKTVESELELEWGEAKLNSRGKSIINYLALEDKKIAERIEELKKEYEEKNG